MVKKVFFKERTIGDIKKLDIRDISSRKGLASKLLHLTNIEGILLRSQVIPGYMHAGVTHSFQAGKRITRRGEYIQLNTSRDTITTALKNKETPDFLRHKGVQKFLEGIAETDNKIIGFSWWPIRGNRDKKILPFSQIARGTQLYCHEKMMGKDFNVHLYEGSQREGIKTSMYEGATLLMKIPSTEEKGERYTVIVNNIPFLDDDKNFALWNQTDITYSGKVPENYMFLFGFKDPTKIERAKKEFIDNHKVCGFLAVSEYFMTQGNVIPYEFSPVPTPTNLFLDTYKKIRNQMIVQDGTLKSKNKLRKPNDAETSLLLSYVVAQEGYNKTLQRRHSVDGKLSDYNWSRD